MSDQPRKDEDLRQESGARDPDGGNPAISQGNVRPRSSGRRRSGRRHSQLSEKANPQSEQRQLNQNSRRVGSRPQTGRTRPTENRPKETNQPVEGENRERDHQEPQSKQDNPSRRTNSPPHRRYKYGSNQKGRVQSSTASQPGELDWEGVNPADEQPHFIPPFDSHSSNTGNKSEYSTKDSNRQRANHQKNHSRRGVPARHDRNETQASQVGQPDEHAEKSRQSGRRRHKNHNNPSQTGRRDLETPDSQIKLPDKHTSKAGKSKHTSRRTSLRTGSQRRVFSPGRDSVNDETEITRPSGTYVSLLHTFTPRVAPSNPIPTDRGIKARSQRGVFSQNWWAQRWIESMEKLVDPARLQRGRSYARSGQVLSINETHYGIEAKVQGSRPAPYKVLITVTPLTDQQWSLVVDALAEQALFTAQLLAGEMPANIEEAFETAGISLFPDRSGDLFTSCSCPDWANPCKHVAATHYILGDRFDDDPFLLFRMRGRSQEEILAELSQHRGEQAEVEEYPVQKDETLSVQQPQPDDLLDRFWETAESLDTFPLTIKPPSMDMPLLTRLGEPAFLPGISLMNILRPVYQNYTYSALRAAYSEEEPVESNPGEEAQFPIDPLNGSPDR